MYQVLYRKWRPQRFSDVVGQPQVTRILANEVKNGRISHAYLFTGSRGTGKTSCAKILAKAVNCLSPIDGDPCGECEICRGIDNGTVLDVVEIDAASNRGIEDIRVLREETAFTPAVAKYRVYIVDEVHMLTIEAFNALLITLEEPPAHVIFILATTEVHKLPGTILSRCQRLDFRRISPEDIAARLEFVASREGRVLHRDAALMLAGVADGAMRDALSLLDRCMSESSEIDIAVVTKATGIMGREKMFSLSSAILQRSPSLAFAVLDELHSASCDSDRICIDLIEHYRNLLLAKTMQRPEKVLVCTPEDLARYKAQAGQITSESILRVLSVLSKTYEALRQTKTGRVEIETAVMRLCSPEADTADISSLVARIAELERQLAELKSKAVPIAVAADIPKEDNEQTLPFSEDDEPMPPFSEDDEPMPPFSEDNEQTLPFSEDDEPMPPFFEDNEQTLPFSEDDEPMPPFSEDNEQTLPFSEDDEPMPPFSEDNEQTLPFSEDDEPMPPFSEDNEPILPFSEDDDPMPLPFEAAEPPQQTARTANKISLNNDLMPEWPRIVAVAKKLAPPLNGPIDGSSAVVNGNTIIINSPGSFLKMLLENTAFARQAIADAAKEITGKDYVIKSL